MPRSFYLLQAEEQQARSLALRQRYNRLSWLRLLLFFGSIALLIVLWSSAGHWGWGFLALPLCLLGFGAFMRWHQGIEAQSEHAAELARQARLELAALDHDFTSWPGGVEFADSLHPYAADLDIFGNFSLFQFLCRSYTAQGRKRLAAWLSDPSGAEAILTRQAVGQELALQPEWCHEFRARGARLQDQPSYQSRLLSWAALPPLVANNGFLRAALWIAPLFFGLAIYLFISLPAWQLGVLALLPAVLLLRRYGQKITELHGHTAAMSEALGHYQALLEWIERAQWKHPHLLALQQPLQKARGAASAIRSLQYALSQLDVRSNPFSFLLEISVLWSLQWLYSLDRWRGRYGSELAAWLEAMTEVDVLVSLANVRLNQADWAFPSIGIAREEQAALMAQKENTAPACSQKKEGTNASSKQATQPIPFIVANAMAHPLLSAGGRVANDFEIAASGQIHLVTGSNMAGKSTWLRCIGVNMVLAMAGAPVCAQSLSMPPLQVWTSMRTQDDLQESTSSFFAELKRLKAIIDAVTAGETYVFFLLDEILKGTNSRDRHTGARALIQQLIKAQGAGLIATHDLELTAMEAAAGQVTNYAMEVELLEGELVFDYKIKRGVSQSFNATVLMAQMGIAIAEKDVNLRHE